ncbi:XRE family transcriptional regulator [Massilia scottii]|uniref:XRE family transcriptional regulator n=1 Tax=Massilia scottii TaxID=3057166 RepID=UPI002796D3CB|nr:XRE family transcriptional regulator [Massilia sp. CCM 9029]MDQ1835209.1 XRE family transcriptional regulator [Massilia sp. CCM 9029]
MTQHYVPTPEEIRHAREKAGLTQTEAAELVCATCNAWQKWEATEGSNSARKMHPGIWKLFKIEMTKK